MGDLDIKDIENLKFRLRILERGLVIGLIMIVVFIYLDMDNSLFLLILSMIILQIYKGRLRKKLRQKEYLARLVDERTMELRFQRDRVVAESAKLSDALEALAKAQDDLVRQEKLATVGHLTQGLIDRILNPLNYINNFANLSVGLAKELRDNIEQEGERMNPEVYADSVELLEMICTNLTKITEHGCNTVRVMKAMEELLKDHRGNVAPMDVNELCKVNIDVLKKSYEKEIEEKNIVIRFEPLKTTTTVDANIEQMGKMMLSMLKNSMYALLKKAEKEEFTPELIIRLRQTSQSVLISIRDNGVGIENNIKEKIFEPFFTTKPTSEAAGVGLYLCREVILNHKGSINMSTEKDKFTQFDITIPIHQE